MARNLAELRSGPSLLGVSRRAIDVFLAVCLALALQPATAPAQVNRLYDEYRTAGLIRPCAHSEAELREGLAGIPADIRAYDPGFADALNAALEQHPSCGKVSPAPATPGGGGVAADGSPVPATAGAASAVAPAPSGEEGADGLVQAALVALVALAGGLAAWLAAGSTRRDTSD
jgi:hypothetical protein